MKEDSTVKDEGDLPAKIDRTLARAMFGSIGRAKCTGGHEPILEELQSPFESPESVIHSFCVGCGNYLELTRGRAEELAAAGGTWLPEDLSDHYLETSSCSLCDGTEKLVHLKPIMSTK